MNSNHALNSPNMTRTGPCLEAQPATGTSSDFCNGWERERVLTHEKRIWCGISSVQPRLQIEAWINLCFARRKSHWKPRRDFNRPCSYQSGIMVWCPLQHFVACLVFSGDLLSCGGNRRTRTWKTGPLGEVKDTTTEFGIVRDYPF